MLDAHFAPVIQWIQAHPKATGIAAFGIAFLESFVVIGSLIPGSAIMIAMGGLIGLEIIPLWSTLAWAILGAILGDAVSYFIGRHYQKDLQRSWPFNRFDRFWTYGERFFARYGGLSIAFGRFIGPLRAFIPVTAGMLGLDVRRYLIANVLSATIWAPVYLAPGYLVGSASQALPLHISLKYLAITVITLVILGGLYWLISGIRSKKKSKKSSRF